MEDFSADGVNLTFDLLVLKIKLASKVDIFDGRVLFSFSLLLEFDG